MKALIVYIGMGNGFKSPAIAISQELKCLGVDSTEADSLMSINAKGFDLFYKKLWELCLKYPIIFDFVYAGANNMTWVPRMLEYPIMRLVEKRILKQLETIKPDFVLSTEMQTNNFYAYTIKKHKLNIPLFCYNSDVIVGHKYWVCNDADAYYVSTQEGYDDLIKHGQKEKSLVLSGFALDRKFKKTFQLQKIERKILGLKNMFTALFVLGGSGIGNALEVVKKIESAGIKAQIIVVCGKNAELKKTMDEYKLKLKFVELVPLGFVSNMQDYLYCADIAIGKSGLNFVFECIYMKKPLIVSMAMANEKFAAKYVVTNGAGYWPKKTKELILDFKKLYNNKNERNKIISQIEKIKTNFNADDIAKDAIERMTTKKTKNYKTRKNNQK